MTPREYQAVYEGYLLHQERMAGYVHNLMGVHLGKKTPKLHEISGFQLISEGEEEIAEGVGKGSLEEREAARKAFGLQ